MTLSPGTRLGQYEVLSALGAGGMGEVWRARDSRLDRQVALKVLPQAFLADPERLARFQREAKVLASLNHPNIAGIHGVEESDGARALVLELVEGPTLADRIARGAIAIDDALAIARQIADALEAAHEQGIVHRDLKPANIKVKADGTVKVLDFGLAKALESRPSDVALTQSPTLSLSAAATQMGVVLGTAAYMSPEQARGKPVDKRSDLWSFGCVLYEMLTGKRAFRGDDLTETLAAVIRSEPDWSALPAATPDATRRLLRHCLSKDPRRRLRDAGDARIELLDDAELPPSRVETRRSQRSGWAIAAIVALPLVVASYVAGRWMASPAEPRGEWRGEYLGGPAIAREARISPDHQMLAFEALVDGLTQVGIMRLPSGQWTVLTGDRSHGIISNVAWAPDGASVYFDRVLGVPRGVFRVPVLGGDARLVLDDAMMPEPLPDGSLVVVRLNQKGDRQLFHYWPESGRLDPLPGIVSTIIFEPSARPSADGSEFLFFGRPLEGEVDHDALYVVDLASGAVRRELEVGQGADVMFGNMSLPLAVTRDGEDTLVQAAAGDLHRIVAAPRSGSRKVRHLFDLTTRADGLDVDADGTVYLNLFEQPAELLIADAKLVHVERRLMAAVRSTAITPWLLPLADDRLLVATRVAGRSQVMTIAPDGSASPLFETREETDGPLSLLGPDRIALLVGTLPERVLAIASTATGRIDRRFDSIDASAIASVAGSRDGRSLYYAAGGQIYAVDLATGSAKPLHPGTSVAVGPGGDYVVVMVAEPSHLRLVKIWTTDGRAEEIAIKSDFALGFMPLCSHAIGLDHRIALAIAPEDSWFYGTGVLDPSTGSIERVWPEVEADMWSGWAGDGRLIAVAAGSKSSLWRFTREASP